MRTKHPLIVVLTCLLLLTGCGGGQEEPPHSTEFVPTENKPYTVEISNPADGTVVDGPDVLVAVTVRAFSLVDKLGDKAKKGEGHVHYYLDADPIPTTAGKPAITTDDKTYHATLATNHTWKDVEPGKHTLGVQLVNNDHTPLEPPVTHQIEITVRSS
jgi:hypothetical protein